MAQFLLLRDDLHRAAAQNEARAHQHRIPDGGRRGDSLLDIGHRGADRFRNSQPDEKLLKEIAVLRAADRLAVGPDEPDAPGCKRLRQVHRGLAAQRRDDPVRLLQLDDVHHILDAQRLKIELVRRRVIRRHGLRVVVDHDGLVARVPDRLHRVHRGVVKLDALPDPDRASPEHDDFWAGFHEGFIFPLVGRIEIRHIALKLRGACVDHLVYRENALRLPKRIHHLLAHPPEVRDCDVRKSHPLRAPKLAGVPPVCAESPLLFYNISDFVEEKPVDPGEIRNLPRICPAADELRHRVDPLR